MSLLQAAYLLAALVLLVLATRQGRLHLFLALVIAAVGFGYAAGMSTSHVGKAFGLGFAQSLNGLGLTVLAAAILAEIADATGATAWLQAHARARRWRSLPVALVGLVASVASTPGAAFAILTPLRRGLGADTPRAALAMALAVSAGHGLLLPAPVMLASMTILGADWRLALAYGVPVALLSLLVGLAMARLAASGEPRPVDTSAIVDSSLHAPGRAALALALTSAVLVAMLITQSLGDIASEPLGGGSNREFLIALGRPLILLLVGAGLMVVLTGHWHADGFSEQGWAGRGLMRATGLVLLIGAAGGLQKIAQDTGMPEMNAERLLDWAPPAHLALLLPFAVATVVKTLQGSSLVAAITASGMMMELMEPLGLGSPGGRALAALAVGAGSMTVSHINDGLFWLTGEAGRWQPGGTLARFSLGTLVQGVVALAALLLLGVFCIAA
ncbi:GntP family permease [Ancylobacter sp. G4_0304]|uniref:GntT/GntP/DsdX family permease n=1 Tax=Ancylobacter sp. G4_0304 TaxID=3114289 RepID=UPI0039C61C5A